MNTCCEDRIASCGFYAKYFSGIILLALLVCDAHAQYPELLVLEERIDSAVPDSRDSFEKILALSQTFRVFPFSRDVMERGLPEKYMAYAQDAYRWAAENGADEDLGRAQRFLLDCYTLELRHNRSMSPIKFIQLAEEMISTNSFVNMEDRHVVFDRLVPLYMRLGIMNRFIELTDSLNRIKRVLKLREGRRSEEYGHIAMAHYQLKDYFKARYYWTEQIHELTKEGDIFMTASIFNNIGLSFAKQYEQDSARHYYSLALTVLEAIHMDADNSPTPEDIVHLRNVISANLIWQDVENGQYDEVIKRVKKELTSGYRQDEMSTVIQACNKLAYVYYLKKSYDDAYAYLDEAAKWIVPTRDIPFLLEDWKLRSKVLLAQGQVGQSELIFRKRIAMEDSIRAANSDVTAQVAAVLYETNKKELELQQQRLLLAERENELIRVSRRQLIFGISLLATLTLLVTTYYFLRHARHQRNEIEKQKTQIDEALKEKELLLKEVHHRVKNNLQVVSSLLGKQGREAESELVKKYMADGQNRIQSMAMIHQQLYRGDNFKSVDLDEYTRLLIAHIADYHQKRQGEVNVSLDVPSIDFHVDVAIPYGLILNELINNCYEYAFSESGDNQIDVTVQEEGDGYYKLTVSDNGAGLPSDIEERSKSSLGLNLVKGLAWQLRGALKYSKVPNGSTFEVTFLNSLEKLA